MYTYSVAHFPAKSSSLPESSFWPLVRHVPGGVRGEYIRCGLCVGGRLD